MASNKLPENLNKLISLGEDCADGANQYGIALPLETNTETRIRADVTDLKNKWTAWATFNTVLPETPDPDAQVQVARSNARAFLMLVRGNMEPHLGKKAGSAWVPLGWPASSLAVPSTSEKLLPHLEKTKVFLTANPAYEINTAKTVMTAARALALWTALDDAVKARNTRDSGQAGAFTQRNTAETKLRNRLRGLIGELEQKMGPLDERWLAFGLNRPGAEDAPDAPENTTAAPMGGGKVFVKCDRVPRTDYYQVWIQVVGVDEDFRRADSPDGPEKMLEGLPVSATVKIKMRAVNEADPGPFGSEVTVVVN